MAFDFDPLLARYNRALLLSNVYGECQVKDTQKKKELANCNLKLYKGEYRMGPTYLKCLIEKSSKPDTQTFSRYSMMKHIRHHGLVEFLNFYVEAGKPRIVLSWIDESLTAWLKDEVLPKCFRSSIHGTYFSPMFRKIIIDICETVEHLFKEGLYPSKIDLKNLFVLKVGKARLVKVLIHDVEQFIHGTKLAQIRERKLWSDVRNIVQEIFAMSYNKAPLNPSATRFLGYIGRGSARKLEFYPDIWTYEQKGCYLFWIVAGKNSISSKLQNVGLSWPTTNSGKLPALLRDVIDSRKIMSDLSSYNLADSYDYVRLCRNIIQRFSSMRNNIQRLQGCCNDREDFLRRMETWEPQIWCILYDAIGWPDQYT